MPRYYRKRQYRRRRNFRPRYKRYRRFKSKWNRQTSMRSRTTIAPDTSFTKLKYVYTFQDTTLPSPSVTLATNFTNHRLIRGNDVFDPQSTGGTVSATGFQQWCAQTGLYQEFVVHASKIKVEIVNADTNALSAALYPIMESNATQSGINGNEQAYVKTAFIGTNSGNNKVIMRNFMKTKKMLGCKDLTDQTLYNGQYNQSPASQILWDWALDCALPNGTLVGNINAKIDVTYYVQFIQRPVVSISVNT